MFCPLLPPMLGQNGLRTHPSPKTSDNEKRGEPRLNRGLGCLFCLKMGAVELRRRKGEQGGGGLNCSSEKSCASCRRAKAAVNLSRCGKVACADKSCVSLPPEQNGFRLGPLTSSARPYLLSPLDGTRAEIWMRFKLSVIGIYSPSRCSEDGTAAHAHTH